MRNARCEMRDAPSFERSYCHGTFRLRPTRLLTHSYPFSPQPQPNLRQISGQSLTTVDENHEEIHICTDSKGAPTTRMMMRGNVDGWSLTCGNKSKQKGGDDDGKGYKRHRESKTITIESRLLPFSN